jgi:CRP/FNR family transcriptional regulator, cyclic AMP receptor protein
LTPLNALSDCEILIVSHRSFLPLLERRPDICIDLMLVLCGRLRNTNQQVEDLAFLDLESQRRCSALPRRAVQEKCRPSRLLSGYHNANSGNSSAGHAKGSNKHLHAWKQSGVVTIKKGKIAILNMAAPAEHS